mgnify:CR=1 FL=1
MRIATFSLILILFAACKSDPKKQADPGAQQRQQNERGQPATAQPAHYPAVFLKPQQLQQEKQPAQIAQQFAGLREQALAGQAVELHRLVERRGDALASAPLAATPPADDDSGDSGGSGPSTATANSST